MGLPYQKHLEWLTIENQSDESIRSFYGNIQFLVPTTNDIASARGKTAKVLTTPAAKRNARRGVFLAEDTEAWNRAGYGLLHAQRCYQGSNSQDAVAKAWRTVGRVLNHPVMRVSIDACTIARMDEERLCSILTQVFKIPIDLEALKVYRECFGNFELFGRNDWTDYLKSIRDDVYVYTRIYAALTRPLDEVLRLCGLPSELAFSGFLKSVLASAAYKFDYYSRQNSVEADAEARRWAKVGFEAGEKYEKFGADDVTDFAKLVQTEFEYVTPEIPTLDADSARQLLPPPPDAPKQ